MSSSTTTVVLNYHLWLLLLSAIRYAIGRTSHVSSYAPYIAMLHQTALTKHQLIQIRDEVKEELDRVDTYGKTLGDRCDDYSWRKSVWELTELLDQRVS